MEQELDLKKQLAEWLSRPDRVTRENVPVLKGLASLYPYFQPLHLLIAKATLDSPEQHTSLAKAALYTNGQLLHHFLHAEREQPHPFNVIHLTPAPANGSQPEWINEAAIDEVTTDQPMERSSDPDEQEVFEEIGEVDFFTFQESFTTETVIPDQEQPDFIPTAMTAPEPDRSEEPVVISKYDDDQLPYTFLWWLAKTRKEHQQIFQPYASPRKPEQERDNFPASTGRPGELQHQYVEHIFHLQSPFGVDEAPGYTTENFRNPTKGDEIIENFIKTDPQISPPKPEQIDNENKAKKSAEDDNDLVSETLAKIYIEQMLYDKAIETYEKLSLKFPEKSRYFADLIQSIEKKI